MTVKAWLNQPVRPQRVWQFLLTRTVDNVSDIRRDYRLTQLEKRLELLEGRQP